MRSPICVLAPLLMGLLTIAADAATTPAPIVNNTTIDYNSNQITAVGSGFSPAEKPPLVAFNAVDLTVVSFSDTSFIATLPWGILAGTYRMRVANSSGSVYEFDVSYSPNPQQGPEGPQGAQGEEGPAGPAGAGVLHVVDSKDTVVGPLLGPNLVAFNVNGMIVSAPIDREGEGGELTIYYSSLNCSGAQYLLVSNGLPVQGFLDFEKSTLYYPQAPFQKQPVKSSSSGGKCVLVAPDSSEVTKLVGTLATFDLSDSDFTPPFSVR